MFNVAHRSFCKFAMMWSGASEVWKQVWTAREENHLPVSYKVTHTPTLWPDSSTYRYLPKRKENLCPHKDLFTDVHATLTAPNWKHPKYPSTGDWANKLRSICAVGHVSAIKRSRKPFTQQVHGGLDLPGCDSQALVVMRQARCLASHTLENVVDEGVHDSRGLGRDAGVRMDLLQHLVHVHGVALLAAVLALLAILLLGLGHSFFRALFRGRSRFSPFRHVYNDNTQQHRKILNQCRSHCSDPDGW